MKFANATKFQVQQEIRGSRGICSFFPNVPVTLLNLIVRREWYFSRDHLQSTSPVQTTNSLTTNSRNSPIGTHGS
jgi:hypothetical protein